MEEEEEEGDEYDDAPSDATTRGVIFSHYFANQLYVL